MVTNEKTDTKILEIRDKNEIENPNWPINITNLTYSNGFFVINWNH